MKKRGGLAPGLPASGSDPDTSESQTIRARLFGASVWLNITVLVLFSPALFVVLGWFTESYRDTASASEVSHRVHEVAFGALFCLALVGAYSQFRPKHNLAGVLQLTAAVVLLAFITTFSIGIDVGLLLYLVPLGILLALRPWGGPVREGRVWGLALILVLISALPFLDETAGLISRALSGAQNHTSHWSAMATFVIILPVLGLVAALRFTGYRLVAWSVSAAAAVYGSASLLFPYDASSHRPGYSVATIVWAACWVIALLRDRPQTERSPRPRRRALTWMALAPLILIGTAVWAVQDEQPNVPHRPNPAQPTELASDVDRSTCLSCHLGGVAGAPSVPHDSTRTCDEQPCWGGRSDCAGCHRIDPGLGGPTEMIELRTFHDTELWLSRPEGQTHIAASDISRLWQLLAER